MTAMMVPEYPLTVQIRDFGSREQQEYFEDWWDFDDIKGVSKDLAALISPSSVMPLINFKHRYCCTIHLAYMEEDVVALPQMQVTTAISIGDWIDSTSDDVRDLQELQSCLMTHCQGIQIPSKILILVASFLFGEEVEKLDQADDAPDL